MREGDKFKVSPRAVKTHADTENELKELQGRIKDGGVTQVLIKDILAPKFHDRGYCDEHKIRALAESIDKGGLIQPIILRRTPQGLERIAGYRRIMAHNLLGLERIKAIIIEANEQSAALFMLAENLHREDLSAYDETLGVLNYISLSVGKTNDETLACIHRHANEQSGAVKKQEDEDEIRLIEAALESVAKYGLNAFRSRLFLLNIHEALKLALEAKQIDYSHAKELHKLRKDEPNMLRLLEKVKLGKISVIDLKAEIKAIQNKPKAKSGFGSDVFIELRAKYDKLDDDKKATIASLLSQIQDYLR